MDKGIKVAIKVLHKKKESDCFEEHQTLRYKDEVIYDSVLDSMSNNIF